MALLIKKFGGTSVGDIEKIKFKLVDLTIAESAFQEYVRKF